MSQSGIQYVHNTQWEYPSFTHIDPFIMTSFHYIYQNYSTYRVIIIKTVSSSYRLGVNGTYVKWKWYKKPKHYEWQNFLVKLLILKLSISHECIIFSSILLISNRRFLVEFRKTYTREFFYRLCEKLTRACFPPKLHSKPYYYPYKLYVCIETTRNTWRDHAKFHQEWVTFGISKLFETSLFNTVPQTFLQILQNLEFTHAHWCELQLHETECACITIPQS